ncbi:MAG: prolipoprotein diacylglyceryl transferase [Candidatus Obscuribacterales bacterium]|nr:prolipoprotein diacylglyceryl transferase [Candidatus Obscuribacterales bacterium]
MLQLGPFALRWYGLLIALGFIAAAIVASRLAERWNLSTDKVINSAFVGFIGGILGARLYFVALSWRYFSSHPMEILATWNGGLSIHGGIIFGVLSGLIYARRVGLPILKTMDLTGCAFPIAQAIGRWGNFFNSEAFGLPVDDSFALKLFIPPDCRPAKYITSEYFHPTFLYESVWNLLLFFFLYFYASKKLKHYPAMTFMLYIGLYSVGRLLIEPLRVDSIMADQIPVPIIASALMLLGSIIAGLVLFRFHKQKPPDEQVPLESEPE